MKYEDRAEPKRNCPVLMCSRMYGRMPSVFLEEYMSEGYNRNSSFAGVEKPKEKPLILNKIKGFEDRSNRI
ncbi:MAG: hypothetical protein ACI4F3_09600 [Enterocloster sp.]